MKQAVRRLIYLILGVVPAVGGLFAVSAGILFFPFLLFVWPLAAAGTLGLIIATAMLFPAAKKHHLKFSVLIILGIIAALPWGGYVLITARPNEFSQYDFWANLGLIFGPVLCGAHALAWGRADSEAVADAAKARLNDRVVPVVLTLFLLGITSCVGYYGYHHIQMVRRMNAMHERNANEPRPVETALEMVGCIRGTLEPGKLGYVDVLDVRITVPCDQTIGVSRIVNGQFSVGWSQPLRLSNGREIHYSNSFTHRTGYVRPLNEKSRRKAAPGSRGVWVRAPETALQATDVFITCRLDLGPQSPAECRFDAHTSNLTSVLVTALQFEEALTDADLTELTHKVLAAVQPLPLKKETN